MTQNELKLQMETAYKEAYVKGFAETAPDFFLPPDHDFTLISRDHYIAAIKAGNLSAEKAIQEARIDGRLHGRNYGKTVTTNSLPPSVIEQGITEHPGRKYRRANAD